ncbi:hypothetical protein ACWGRJ_40220 [Bradyrhizobium sp. Lot11]
MAAKLAILPEKIRGFGHVKRANAEMAKREEQRLLQQFEAIRNPAPGRITDVA